MPCLISPTPYSYTIRMKNALAETVQPTRFRGAKRGANDRRHRATPGYIRPFALARNGTSGHTRHHPATLRKCLLSSRSRVRVAGEPKGRNVSENWSRSAKPSSWSLVSCAAKSNLHVLYRPALLWTMGARSEVYCDRTITFHDRRIVRSWREQFQMADSARPTIAPSESVLRAQTPGSAVGTLEPGFRRSAWERAERLRRAGLTPSRGTGRRPRPGVVAAATPRSHRAGCYGSMVRGSWPRWPGSSR